MKKLLIYLANDSKFIIIIMMIIGLLVTLSFDVTPWIHLSTNNQYHGFIYLAIGGILLGIFDQTYKLYCIRIKKEKYNILSLIMVIIIIIIMISALLVMDGGMLLRFGAGWNLD